MNKIPILQSCEWEFPIPKNICIKFLISGHTENLNLPSLNTQSIYSSSQRSVMEIQIFISKMIGDFK